MDTVANERRGRSSEDIMFIEINPAHNREGQTIQTPRQSHRPEPMPAGAYLKFRNDRGVREICIGVKEFKCIGESPPQDHPHIYINMGEADTILCPYCGTGFRFDPRLTPLDTEPPDSLFAYQNAALPFAVRLHRHHTADRQALTQLLARNAICGESV